jgi:Winged helix-turn helix
MRLHEEFGLSVSDDTIYRALKDLGFSHVSARPKAYKQDADAMAATGYRTASSNPSTTSSTTAATPEARSSISRGNHVHPPAIGQSPVTQLRLAVPTAGQIQLRQRRGHLRPDVFMAANR